MIHFIDMRPTYGRYVARRRPARSTIVLHDAFGGTEDMARVRVMYWKEIPVQVQGEDANGRVSRQLEDRFQQAADAVAMQDGSEGTDEYLDGWGFGPYEDGAGTATDAAEAVATRLEKMPADFVKKIIGMHRDGTRDPVPGAIDHWALGAGKT